MTSDKTINTATEELTNILIDASKSCLKLAKTAKRKVQKNRKKEYFNSECCSEKKELQRL